MRPDCARRLRHGRRDPATGTRRPFVDGYVPGGGAVRGGRLHDVASRRSQRRVLEPDPAMMDPDPTTLVDLLSYRAAQQADTTAFVFLVSGETESDRLSFAALDRRARA